MGSVKARIEILADRPEAQLRDMEGWLADNSSLHGSRILLVEQPIAPGQLGGLPEAIEALLQAEVLAAFIGAVGGWLVARTTRRTKIRVRVDDRQVEIEAGPLDDPVEVARQMLDELTADRDL